MSNEYYSVAKTLGKCWALTIITIIIAVALYMVVN